MHRPPSGSLSQGSLIGQSGCPSPSPDRLRAVTLVPLYGPLYAQPSIVKLRALGRSRRRPAIWPVGGVFTVCAPFTLLRNRLRRPPGSLLPFACHDRWKKSSGYTRGLQA